MSSSSTPAPKPAESWFVTTHWSVVLRAGHADTPRASEALSRLCETYWYPLYAYIRRRGYSPTDAEDLTQEFFARLIERKLVQAADRDKGRFRSFLLTVLKHFLADEWDRAQAQKRGGLKRIVPLEAGTAETRFQLEPIENTTPEKIYEKQWAVTVLENVFAKLRREYATEGKEILFGELKDCLTKARSALLYGELAGRLKMSEGALRVAVHRLRQRYRELLRAEIAHTVGSPEEVEEELRYLFRVIAG